jgi:hypothetical protein
MAGNIGGIDEDEYNTRRGYLAQTPGGNFTHGTASELASTGFAGGLAGLHLPSGTLPSPRIPTPNTSGFGFNLGTFDMLGNVMGGIGSLAKGYAAIKGLGIAKKQLAFQREAFDKNFGQQKQAYDDTVRQYNNIQGERQAFVNATHADPSLSNIKTLQLA